MRHVGSSRTAPASEPDDTSAGAGVYCALERLLSERGRTLTWLSHETGITMANLSILKTNKARAVRMSTIALICRALDVTPGDLFRLKP